MFGLEEIIAINERAARKTETAKAFRVAAVKIARRFSEWPLPYEDREAIRKLEDAAAECDNT